MRLISNLKNAKLIQVALDFINIQDAEKVAIQAIKAGAGIIEAGTPLVKAEGIRGLKRLRELNPNGIILADTKTADAGDVEVEIAKAGDANIMTVLGIMDDATIESAVKRAHELGLLVQADLINVRDVIGRAQELKKLQVDIIGLHVGLDVQKKRGISIVDLKNEIMEISNLNVIISVAGGLNKDRIKELVNLPINIFVVGGAITRAHDPFKATEEIVKIINA
ncbi:D-arabino 3-hexulose 6-phosphate aldehyde lyase [Sulfolobus acidocaldarius]|nr:orotidine 5'-phosphate decarboxylase / HUMPS family protein [Sulfolobus acidocaldarius]ALU30532.1 D-arabino 3-hexulose 6-phosphate aldehyde lyase [Sulfolobus acidocaldarius]ALU32793.1 D-arabino 3-hexulose 6-phosphate aldehyde lyase [Sulfolobus acidocaldarius]